jgi:hypothetical protein
MLDFHWIKAMLFFRKYYDFLQFFLHHGIFFPAILSAVVFFRNTTAGGKIPCLNKGNNKITELRTILQRESQNS